MPQTTYTRALRSLCVGHTVQACVRVAELIYRAAGSKTLRQGQQITRFWCDIHASGQHQSASAQQYHNAGARLLGLDHPMG